MIVVTGLGAITALGSTLAETWERLVRGECGLRELTLFDAPGYRSKLVGEATRVPGPEAYPGGNDYSRTSELGLLAAREALAHAGLARGGDARWSGRRVGLVMGGSTAGMLETESLLAVLVSPEGTVDPAAREEALGRMLSHPLSAPTDRLVRELGPFARVRTLSSACSSGANAIAIGASWLELDLVDVVLCGAADALCRVTLSGFNALAAIDPAGARPFDRRRKGLSLGEAAGFVVLERAEGAAARKKDAVCTLLGWATRSEAHHITNPEPTGAAPIRAMQASLARAGLAPSGIDYINAHGTGTPLNDPMESRALERVFGADLAAIPVSSNKGQVGHTLAAAGAIEAAITALSIAEGMIPPTGGLEEPDPACPLRHVLRAEKREVRAAMSSSFAFGGMDTVLVLGQAPSGEPPPMPRPTYRRVVVTGVASLTPGHLLAGEAVATLPSLPSAGPAIEPSLLAGLDADRARRLDRASRLGALVAEQALAGAGAGDPEVGVVLGSAFGAVDASATFMRRLVEKGARLVSPADFPSLVPSSPAGHVSIYLGLKGPSMVVADLATSGECALTHAFELITAGEASRLAVVAVEERSAIVEQVLSVLFDDDDASSDAQAAAKRREGAAALALASADVAGERGLPIFAEIASITSWSAGADPLEGGIGSGPLASPIPSPLGEGVVVLGCTHSHAEDVLARSGWASCPRVVCSDHAGTHEAVGGMALAVAAAMIARGEASEALCLGTARGSGYAAVLRRWVP